MAGFSSLVHGLCHTLSPLKVKMTLPALYVCFFLFGFMAGVAFMTVAVLFLRSMARAYA